MKIAHIKSIYDRIGGIESLIEGVMPELVNMSDVEPLVIVIGDQRNEEIERRLSAQGQARLVFLRWRGLKGVVAASRELGRVLTEENVDLVHSHDMRANLLIALLRPFRALPWLCHMHGWLGETHKGRYKVYEAIDRRLVARADHVMVGSHAALEEVQAAGARKSSVAANAVNLPELSTGDRDALGLPAEAVVFTITGRLHFGKGQDLFLRALAALDDTIPWHAVVIGVGPAEAELKAMAEELGIAARVQFTGFVDSIAPWIAASDAIAVPSRKESLPLTCLEAMAAARPVVVSHTGDLPRVVQDGETGLVVPVGDIGALSAAFDRLARDATLRKDMGQAARRAIEAGYTVSVLARAMVAVAQTLVTARRSDRKSR